MSHEGTGPYKTVTYLGHRVPAIEATSITRTIGTLAAVRGMSIAFCGNKITAVVSDNGGGRSTRVRGGLSAGRPAAAFIDGMRGRSPVRRSGAPDDVAAAAFVTGTTRLVDGGRVPPQGRIGPEASLV